MKQDQEVQLRLEILCMRAQLQRMEFTQQFVQVRQSLAWTEVLGGGLQKIFSANPIGASSAWIRYLSAQYPYLTAVGSLGLTLFRKPILKYGVRLGGLVTVGAGLFYWWQSKKIKK
jgi:hypothetical protein